MDEMIFVESRRSCESCQSCVKVESSLANSLACEVSGLLRSDHYARNFFQEVK